MRTQLWMIFLAALLSVACEVDDSQNEIDTEVTEDTDDTDSVAVVDCSNDGHCDLDCPGDDPDCDFCGDDSPDRCVTGCASIDVDCQCANSTCPGQCFEEVCFVQGDISYADEILTYDNTYSGNPPPPVPGEVTSALHAPDDTSITLGQGGLLEVLFTDNVLTNSGDALKDLFVFEIGIDVEASFIWARALDETAAVLTGVGYVPLDGWFEIGRIEGSTRQIDIDAAYPGFEPGELRFDAVRILDDKDQGDSLWDTPGADIDAVGAIATIRVESSS